MFLIVFHYFQSFAPHYFGSLGMALDPSGNPEECCSRSSHCWSRLLLQRSHLGFACPRWYLFRSTWDQRTGTTLFWISQWVQNQTMEAKVMYCKSIEYFFFKFCLWISVDKTLIKVYRKLIFYFFQSLAPHYFGSLGMALDPSWNPEECCSRSSHCRSCFLLQRSHLGFVGPQFCPRNMDRTCL